MDTAHHLKEGNGEKLKGIAVSQNMPLDQRKQAVDALTEMEEEMKLLEVIGMEVSGNKRTDECKEVEKYAIEKFESIED